MGKENQGSSQRLVACLTTIYLFAKIRPQLLVNHAITLQPYLSLKCQVRWSEHCNLGKFEFHFSLNDLIILDARGLSDS